VILSNFFKKGLNYDYLVSCFLANDTSDAFVFVYNRVLRNINITTSLHHHIITSPHHHITASPHHRITASPHHHITASPHHHITSHHHITIMDSLLGQEFKTISQARDTIKDTIISAGLSYKKLKSTQTCYIVVCKDNICIVPVYSTIL
jgi:hypothetical protein